MALIPSEPLVPKHAPYPCCGEDVNLDAFQMHDDQPPPVTDVNTGDVVTMVAGFRRCRVCGRRHFFARRRDFFTEA